MKKANLALILAVILFSIINVSLVQAGTVTVKVQYQNGCPRSGAYIKEVHCRGLYIFTYLTDENGYTSDTGFPPNTLCWFQAFWPNLGNQFGPQMIIQTDGNGDGNVTITHDTLNYPNGTEPCGSAGCTDYKYCYSGNPPYVQCGSWQTDCGTCCKCNGGTQYNPQQNYDSSQNGDCSFCQKCTAIDTCGNQADGEDIKDECPTDSCKYGYCNGAGSCKMKSSSTDCGTCALCNGQGNCNVYDSTQNSDCNPFDIATCTNDPDLNPFTWDLRDSYCTGLNTCYQGTITHTCDKTTCNAPCSQASDCSNNCNGKQWYSIYSCNSGCNCDLSNPICSVGHCNAECASSGDCGNKCMGQVRYYSGSCLSSCDCSWSTESCDAKDGCYAYDTGCEMRDYSCSPSSCTYTYSSRNVDYYDSYVNYCSADTIRQHRTLHDFYCNGQCSDHTSWQNDTLIQNCSSQDNWYNTSTTQWISSGLCTEKQQVWQEYRDYTCSAAVCTYSVTQNRWYDTGQTRNKADGTSCDDSKWCTVNDKCSSGVCSGNARDCSDAFSCTDDSCDETNDRCVNTPNNNKCTPPQVCIPSTPPTGCGETIAPVITISSPQNTTYYLDWTNTIDLNFTLNKQASWIGYSMDGQPNVTIPQGKSTTLSYSIKVYMPSLSPHNIRVYANDTSNNMGSQKVFFSVKIALGGGCGGPIWRGCRLK